MPRKILFICSGNTCRSVMAEFLLRYLAKQRGLNNVEVGSAGTAAIDGRLAHPEAAFVLKEFGIDVGSHRSRLVSPELLDWADLVLTMMRGHKEILLDRYPQFGDKVFTLAEFVDEVGDVQDPSEWTSYAFRQVRDRILDLVLKLLERLQALEQH